MNTCSGLIAFTASLAVAVCALGGEWKGDKPEFRNLRWIQGAREFAIGDYGARADDSVLNTTAIQSAIDACSQSGGGTVVIPAGRFVIGTIRMKDNVTLHFGKGAVLLGSTNLADYATDVVGAVEAPAFNRCLIYAQQATNIGFTGNGLVDARGCPKAFPHKVGKELGERPMLMRLVECGNVRFKDLSFKDSASWGLHMLTCRNLVFDGIRIDSRQNNVNNDGIDFDGCVNVLIENCMINSGDDAICGKSTTKQVSSNIVVRGCTLSSHTACFKLGTSSRGGFQDITLSDCRFRDCPMGAIKLLMVDGGRLENVLIDNIRMENVGGPIFIRLGNRGRLYDKPTEQVYGRDAASEGAAVGVLRKVTIRNIEATITGNQRDCQGILITGIPGHRIEDVVLENIRISLPGGGTAAEAARVMPEDVARYPEQFFFGVLSSSVLYARHMKGLVARNLDVTFDRSDARPPLYAEDVEGLDRTGVVVR